MPPRLLRTRALSGASSRAARKAASASGSGSVVQEGAQVVVAGPQVGPQLDRLPVAGLGLGEALQPLEREPTLPVGLRVAGVPVEGLLEVRQRLLRAPGARVDHPQGDPGAGEQVVERQGALAVPLREGHELRLLLVQVEAPVGLAEAARGRGRSGGPARGRG